MNASTVPAVGPVRIMTIWCPDWPVVAARRVGETGEERVAVLRANRVVAASATARSEGVVRAMRRREAQARCPDIVLITDDPGRDARAFEPVAAAIDAFTPRNEIMRPGLCQFPTRGPSRYFGGDGALAAKLVDALRGLGIEARVGVADGPFAAALAGRSSTPLVPQGESTAFLAPYSIDALVAVEGGRAVVRAARSTRRASAGSPGSAGSRASAGSPGSAGDADALALIDLVDLLKRLGIGTLGALAALPLRDVSARFGPLGERVWRLAAGLDERPVSPRRPPPDVVVSTELDPPVDRVDTAAFIAKALAEELADRLARHGLACTRISIEAETERGDRLVRLWRHERAGATGGLTAAGLADRVRWQLDGWLQALQKAGDDRSEACFGGITVLRLVPDEVVAETGRQLGLWGGAGAADERAARAFARVQGLVGPDAVCTVHETGGRRPTDLVQLVPWGDHREVASSSNQPWPGSLPAPQPTVVYPHALPAEVCDASGALVGVGGRGEPTAAPATLRLTAADRASDIQHITQWAGPWPLDERWWDVQSHRRQARMQVVTRTGEAHLVVLEGGAWWVEASYS